MNQLFPDDATSQTPADSGFVLARSGKKLTPTGPPRHEADFNPAAELIRRKIDALYDKEPNAREELQDKAVLKHPRSKHQQFMHDLSTSGKSLAAIQTEWHRYYQQLPDNEKHEVWQEFYQANERHPSNYTRFVRQHAAGTPQQPAIHPQPAPPHTEHAAHKSAVFLSEHLPSEPADTPPKKRTAADIHKQILQRIRSRARVERQAKKHLQSLLVGLGIGTLACIITLFSFLNEVIIAPLIRPASSATATPIILDTDSLAPNPNPEVIIPKINAQLPVVYTASSSEEGAMQTALNDGVVHYPGTAVPGQQGNAGFFGHSSNNIFNKGKYKFAFVLLHELKPGDVFHLTYNNTVYSYHVFKTQVVEPGDTWVLGPVAGKASTVTLITCDPPGTSFHRLVVWGEQISPDPSGNQSNAAQTTPPVEQLTSEGPTLWTRFWRTVNPFD